MTATLPLTKSGSSISTLWKPSNVTVGTGLFALASDNLGTLNLSLTGLESRSALRISDSNGTVRELTSNTFGGLFWNNYDVSGALNTITNLKYGVSGLSLGGGTGANHRLAVHEVEIGDPNHTPGHYMYGMGLYVGATTGTAFWGGHLPHCQTKAPVQEHPLTYSLRIMG